MDLSQVENLTGLFNAATSFNQDLSDWNVTGVTTIMDSIFSDTPALSSTNKGKIHKTFSSNPNWPHGLAGIRHTG